MLTGDQPGVAHAVARQVGVDRVRAALLPEDKLDAITAMQAEGRVVAMVGDGGLAVHQGELAVLAKEAPHVVLVVFNDGGYGVLRNIQKARGAKKRGVDLLTPDFALLAESVGLPHRRVDSAEAFDKALRKALKRGGPSMIEIDVAALRPKPAKMVPPIEVPSSE